MEYILKTNMLTKQFKQQKAVDSVSINIERGAIYGLIGRNGAGKTTFMKMASGLSKPTSGEFEILGMNSSRDNMGAAFERIGTLIEQPGIYPKMNAFDNLKLKALCCGVYSKEYVNEKLALVGLSDVGKKPVGKFSLGMKQRLGIAMALIGEPDLLILDEPINGLDPQGIVEVREIIKKINREKGTTIIISSHILEELSKIATHYGFINKGRLIEEINHEELLEKCADKIEIITYDIEKACVILDNMNCTGYKVVDKQTIHITGNNERTAEINAALISGNVAVRSISQRTESLENYFIELVNKAQ